MSFFEEISPEMDRYLENHASSEPDILKRLRKETFQKTTQPHMISGYLQGRLLAIISKMLQPKNILEIGTSWGISTLYLRLAGRQSEITVVEPLPEIHDFAESLFAEVGEKADFVREEYATFLLDYFRQTPERLYIVVNRLPKPYYRALPDLLAPVLDMHALLIIDGIRSNSEVKSWWEKLVKDERVRVTVDMKNVGLVCCDPKLNKQDYQVSL